uniref:BM9 protective ANTIGEN=ANGIOTENSIN-converting enzyme homolog (Fragments) n=1 Tax=Rhipicephalus microplus TaxID=6941 RepID=Q9TXF9_RHIMP
KLLQTWLAWHNAVGPAIKQYYIPYIKKSAWLSDYETEDMTEIVDKEDGTIPAHLLGNMWA